VLSDGKLSVNENSTVNVTCQVDAMPSPSTSALRWYRNGSLVYTGQYYVISAVQRHDVGEYRCTTSNTLTPSQGNPQISVGSASFHLTVMCKNLSLNYLWGLKHAHKSATRNLYRCTVNVSDTTSGSCTRNCASFLQQKFDASSYKFLVSETFKT